MDYKNQSSTLHSNSSQALRVLDYWHKIEFFESTDIKELEEEAEGVIKLTPEELQDPTCLPWINPQQIRRAGKNFSPAKKYNYTLYFGIFDRSEIFERAKCAFPDIIDDKEEQNQDEGRTCSITLYVDQDGYADKDSFAFSTVTWAIGQLEKNGLDNITLSEYEKDTEKLRQRFLDVTAVADNLKQQYGLPPKLTTYEIIEFLKSMAEWTDFSPEISTPALYIKLTQAKRKNRTKHIELDINSLPHLSTLLKKIAKADIDKLKTESSTPSIKETKEITILNSFYIRDIERIMECIKRDGFTFNAPLERYLSDTGKRKPDLLKPDGKPLLLEMLRLNKLPLGRWPTETAHSMSLMQQFAINTIEEELAQSGLYSVNGPPGTGKTTMLRDLIASNLVKRAEVLAALNSAADAFSHEITVTSGDKQRTVKCLSPSLTGFEMIVVSSNNAAVENISQELPQIKSLGKSWQDISYLKPVAQKLAAFHELPDGQDKYKITPLTEKTECWGLIAAALGKQKNREIFGTRAIFQTTEKCIAPPPADQYRTLAAAIKQLANSSDATSSFTQAQNAFQQAQKDLEILLNELKKLEGLPILEENCRVQKQKAERERFRVLCLNTRLTKLQQRKINWWDLRIRHRCRLRAIITGLTIRRNKTEAQYQKDQYTWEHLQAELESEQQTCMILQEKYAGVLFTGQDTDLEAPAIQRTAFGQCPALNEARNRLTVKALELHQAWLAAAYKECHLSDSLLVIMNVINGSIADKQAAKALWQLLFMIVPVVSSTFASVARQFSALDDGDIGWLFIDEAGQATPQQAVGALWRAKRAIVVGDPLQIEPVFTIPPAFVEGIAKRELGEQWKLWSPTITSVQNLADRVNPYGTEQIAKNTWLGSPLRVHRRCDEPMFSIANEIAYNNKMLHGLDNPWSDETFFWGPSCWFDVRGCTEGKHFVPEQAQHVLTMLQAYIDHYQKLPDAYIISPFKHVKKELNSFLKEKLSPINGRNKWLDERIGTVHTFQGKEEKNVIFVLGLSTEKRGATKWASSRPNLLNVAVTRAQKRVYIVGSKEIWSGCKYFSVANELLQQTTQIN
ncbi:DEAD/DEAH box helicase [Photorhabdus heterorhabditis]|uniref:DEAD/DEAH box helicase n=1 Tax=Photorhabdus heterorhabditis TaxID=880156 RepID=UPI00156285BE|nr:DEAD/DEAH box helicase [Photorhabdus heterorhabditis]NRN28166.1 ATP-binding domain-containing protein [Photorhabdus heterorhabditis subsp. aluminescens]